MNITSATTRAFYPVRRSSWGEHHDCSHCDTPQEKLAMTVLGSSIIGMVGVGGIAHLAVEAMSPAPVVGQAVTLAAGAAGAVAGWILGRDWLCQ